MHNKDYMTDIIQLVERENLSSIQLRNLIRRIKVLANAIEVKEQTEERKKLLDSRIDTEVIHFK